MNSLRLKEETQLDLFKLLKKYKVFPKKNFALFRSLSLFLIVFLSPHLHRNKRKCCICRASASLSLSLGFAYSYFFPPTSWTFKKYLNRMFRYYIWRVSMPVYVPVRVYVCMWNFILDVLVLFNFYIYQTSVQHIVVFIVRIYYLPLALELWVLVCVSLHSCVYVCVFL